MVIGASDFPELVASTLEKIEKTAVDQVLTKHPTLDLFKANARSYTGRELVLNLEGAEDNSTAFTDDAGSFDTTRSPEIIGASQWEWANPLVSKVRVKYTDIKKNSGPEQLVDLVRSHLNAAMKHHAKTIARALHARMDFAVDEDNGGFDYGPVTGQFDPFDAIVSDATYDATPGGTGSAFTVGNIDASSADYWQATRYESPLDGGESIRKAFRSLRNQLLVNNAMAEVTHIVAGQDIFEEYEDSFDDKVRYNFSGSGSPDGQGQFRAIFDANIEVRLDPDCPPQRAYFLNVPALRLGYLDGEFMKAHPEQAVTGTLESVTPIASILTTATNERRTHGLLLRPTTAGGDA